MDNSMKEEITRWRHVYFSTLCLGMEQQRKSSQYTDTTVTVGKKTFECHKVILAAMSPFFESKFSMQESQSSDVTLKDINSQTFENILKFIYSGADVINTENVDIILQAATILQIKCLKERCVEFMIENVNQENCIAFWKLASSHTCSFLSRKAFKDVLYYFQDIRQTEEFLNLDYDDVLAIIKDNNLRTSNEESVCEAVFRWLNHDIDNRKQFIDKIMEHIRLPLMQPEYLLKTLETNTLVNENDKCREYVKEAKSYHLLSARKHGFVSARLVHRNQDEYEENIICIGGHVHPHPEKTTTDVLCYSMNRFQWIQLASLPYNLGVDFAICTYGNAVYVSGGSEKPIGMIYLDALHNSWFISRCMLIGRRRHCMVAVGDSLYVLGGNDDEDKEGYNTLISIQKIGVMSECWENCGNLVSPVESASASVLQDKIYVFGGLDGDGVNTSAVQCFDTRVKTCTHLTNLPSLSGMSSAVVCNKTTYLVFPSGEVLKMNGTGERCGEIESAGNIENFNRLGFGIVQHEGKIFIIGGKDSSDIFNKIIIFDPTTGERADSGRHYTTQSMFGFGCAKATIPQSVFVLKIPLAAISQGRRESGPEKHPNITITPEMTSSTIQKAPRNNAQANSLKSDTFESVKIMIMNAHGKNEKGKCATERRKNAIQNVIVKHSPRIVLFQEFVWKGITGKAWAKFPLPEYYEYKGHCDASIMYDTSCITVEDLPSSDIQTIISDLQGSANNRLKKTFPMDFNPLARMCLSKVSTISKLLALDFICISWHGKSNENGRGKMKDKNKIKYFEYWMEFLRHIREKYDLPIVAGGDYNVHMCSIEAYVTSPFKLCNYKPSTRRTVSGIVDYCIVTDDLDFTEIVWVNLKDTNVSNVNQILDHDPIVGSLSVSLLGAADVKLGEKKS